MSTRVVSLLTDYGRVDEFVGVMHGVLRSLAPGVELIDICHEVPPFDVSAGAVMLARAIQYVPPGAVVAVVDPGVGTTRRAIAVQAATTDGAELFLVGPDNGLLAPAVAVMGGPRRVVTLENPAFVLQAPGATFAGRDVFAPAAAHLVCGGALSDLGPECDPLSLLPMVIPVPHERDDGGLEVSVLWVDRFGNAQLNVGPGDVSGDQVLVRIGDVVRRAAVVHAFGDLPAGQIGLVLDSYGLYALALDRDSAAAILSIKAGSRMILEVV